MSAHFSVRNTATNSRVKKMLAQVAKEKNNTQIDHQIERKNLMINTDYCVWHRIIDSERSLSCTYLGTTAALKLTKEIYFLGVSRNSEWSDVACVANIWEAYNHSVSCWPCCRINVGFHSDIDRV